VWPRLFSKNMDVEPEILLTFVRFLATDIRIWHIRERNKKKGVDTIFKSCYTFIGSPPRGVTLNARLMSTSFFLPGE